MTIATRSSLCVALLVLGAASAASCDPVEGDAITALGGEAPGVRRGPLHRPGQPCLLCHDGAIGDPPAFSIAGTVFETPTSALAEDGATVSLTDANMSQYVATTNGAGNFYLTPSEWSPVFPLSAITVTSASGMTVTMQSNVGRDGACATCHFDPAGADSPGHVCVSLDDGGVPP